MALRLLQYASRCRRDHHNGNDAGAGIMLRRLWKTEFWKTEFWKTWTIDKPAAFGDLLWQIFVVQFAALLNRLTLRRIIAIVPFVLVILAYAHQIPLPPELMLVGDALAYIDVLSVILLLTILSRVSNILFFAKQAANHALELANRMLIVMRRFGLRHRREGSARGRRRLIGRSKPDDDYPALGGVAWA
jgi:hypothetical protein